MRLLPVLLAVLLHCCHVQAYAVFAHFMVGNVPDWTIAMWQADITLAKTAKIDAFVLNMAEDTKNLDLQLTNAFSAANTVGFKLFFSFDYMAGAAPRWSNNATVIALINKWKGNAAYYKHLGKPLASTFEGHKFAADWIKIKANTGCFFVPSYSSQDVGTALSTGAPDGLFGWSAWPWGGKDLNTFNDEYYISNLKGKPYMMAVSPWFFTNLPGYNKNWVWRGDDLWYDRWRDVFVKRPEFVQILSWNDYGESHYIGPIRTGYSGPFTSGKAPVNYVTNMNHDGWRLHLPYLIDTYKLGTATVTKEGLVTWYRRTAKAACPDGSTTGNTASQLQIEFTPAEVVQDKIFFSALLSKNVNMTVDVKIGTTIIVGTFTKWPISGGIGIHYGSVNTGGLTGAVIVTLRRNKVAIASVIGATLITTCTNGIQNYNAWVGSDVGRTVTAQTPISLSTTVSACNMGAGPGTFNNLCVYTCAMGYCPASCQCLRIGPKKTRPATTGKKGYPAKGINWGAAYVGLCDFACNYNLGWCASSVCGTVSYPLVAGTGPSPFLPLSCTAGKGLGALAGTGLCEFTCKYGHCPIHLCTCTTQAALITTTAWKPDTNPVCLASTLLSTNRDNNNICRFAGERGFCPTGPCQLSSSVLLRERDGVEDNGTDGVPSGEVAEDVIVDGGSHHGVRHQHHKHQHQEHGHGHL